MGEGKKQGVAAALEIVGPGAPPLAPFQLPLHLTEGAADGVPVPAAAEDKPRGRGRPPGSRNKRTDEMVDYLLARYQSPLVVLAEIYSRSLDVLVAELGCEKIEAFRLQVEAARNLAPYVHQKQPVAVEIDPSGVVRLIIETGARQIAGAGDDDGSGLVIDGRILDDPPAEENP